MIEADEIFKQIKENSQTIGQTIVDTNYILSELKDYRDIYANANQRCKKCGNNLTFANDKKNDIRYLQCENCGYIER